MNNDIGTHAIDSRGTEVTRINALRHGVLSRYTVLPWEDGAEYHVLLEALQPTIVLRVPRKSTSSRSLLALSGANGGFGWPKRPHTVRSE